MVKLQSLAFWFFLPRVVAYIQSFLYALLFRAGDPKPQPGSLRYVKHQRAIHTSVLVIFLLFSIYQADWDMRQEGTLYSALGVPPSVDDRGLASRFRRITAVLHPDKIAEASRRALAEVEYVRLKDYRDVLADPARRYAYDRLGPSILPLDAKTYRTYWDFVQYGGSQAMQTYLGGLALMLLAQYVGVAPARHRFWQTVAFLSVFALNMHLLTHSVMPGFLRGLNMLLGLLRIEPLLPYQFLRLVSTTTISSFIALQQAAGIPPLPSQRTSAVHVDTVAHNHQQLNEIITMQNNLSADGMRLLEMEAAPFQGDERLKRELRERMADWILQNAVRSDAKVRNAVGQQILRRREGAPAGARGTT